MRNDPRSSGQPSEQFPRKQRGRGVWIVVAALVVVGVALLYYNDVSTEVTSDDAVYAERILQETGHEDLVAQKAPQGFEAQVDTILAVQDAVLSITDENRGIPFDQLREPGNLYYARAGLCFDRSRVIEKILSTLGFSVRHAFVSSTRGTGSAILAFLRPKIPSHAVTEVKTERGWLVVDSNRRWIGLTDAGKPVDLDALQETEDQQAWDTRVKEPMSSILSGPYSYVFGLYSRHGRFYPPYVPVPDVDWGQIPYNFTD